MMKSSLNINNLSFVSITTESDVRQKVGRDLQFFDLQDTLYAVSTTGQVRQGR